MPSERFMYIWNNKYNFLFIIKYFKIHDNLIRVLLSKTDSFKKKKTTDITKVFAISNYSATILKVDKYKIKYTVQDEINFYLICNQISVFSG